MILPRRYIKRRPKSVDIPENLDMRQRMKQTTNNVLIITVQLCFHILKKLKH